MLIFFQLELLANYSCSRRRGIGVSQRLNISVPVNHFLISIRSENPIVASVNNAIQQLRVQDKFIDTSWFTVIFRMLADLARI